MTDTRLPCYTVAMPPGDYIVRVYVKGNLIPIKDYTALYDAKFYISQSYTPIITNISPTAGPPQRLVSLLGDFKTKCYSRDINECSLSNISVISRIYIGDQSCNLIDPTSGLPYGNVTTTSLQCRYESNAVGIFNVTVHVTNEYGRSTTSTNLYRLSATGQTYTFQTYASISNISPSSGSIQGGTMLTISGQYFSNSSQYPLVVNVGNEPCTILNVNLTTIQCQTSPVSNNNRTHYHGGRGLHLFSENVFTNFSNSQNSTHRMPNNNANKTWISEASFISNNVASTTIWLIGYLRPPKTATFTFLLDTNVNSVLYLSTDDKPENRILIANNNSPRSKEILLQNNTNYYLFCMGSTQRGSFRLTIKVKMHDGKTVVGNSNNLGTAEIQRINVGFGSVREQQRITYSDAYVDEVAETQDIVALSAPFQIGFRGAYTVLLADPELLDVEMALNDLPTIYPLKVTVALALASFRITFPTDMGDVPLLTIISSAYNIPQNATEIIQGVASGSKLAFQLEDQTTQYLDFSADFLTNAILQDQFEELFNIQCPPSLYKPDADSSIVHVEEFETLTISNGVSPMTNTVFCGRKAALVNNYQNLITDNSELADYMCFAYKLPNGIESLRLYMRVESDKNFDMYTSDNIVTSVSLISDTYWHYTCLDLREILEAYSLEYVAASIFVIKNVYLRSESNGVLIDTVTLRTSKPFKYENEYLLDTYDQSSSCTFPFYYNGRNHTRCILNDEGLPICRSLTNAIHYCQRSSVEGIRRLYPKYQLLDNSISINHRPQNRTIDISFRYTECNSPSLIKAFPASHVNVTSITTASKPLYGTYDIEFNGQTYTSIPAVIDQTDMSNLLQFYANTGYNLVNRTGDCGSYSYTVTWLSKGKQPLIKIVNTNDVRPIGISINVSSIQLGADGDVFYNLPNDITRTYHNGTQVEVIIGDQSSYCSTVNNNCQFQYSIQQTPTIVSIVQNGIILRINGDGFRPSTELNIVVIGEQGLCTVTVANTTFLLCTIANAPSGQQIVRVNVADKGFALSNGNLLVNVPLSIASFNPNEGGIGGGYALTIYGNGFSSNSIVTIDGNLCSNSRVINFSSIICIVPSSKRISASQVIVSVIDNENSVNAASLFTYNATDTPIISSIVPNVTTMTGELLNITGTGFGNSIDSVFVGTKSAKILSSSNTNIQIRLPELSPGLYPISINTSKGPARSINPIEYRFYIEKIFPQIGSLYGGNDVYIYGNGFDNSTNIQFRTENNRLSPCNIISVLSNKIHCQTTSFAQQITITADGVHPLYGSNFSWSSPHQVVQLGTIVTWIWNSSAIFLPRRYKIQQVMNAYSTQPSVNGFDSGIATTSGSYFYQFNSLGTFYYWSRMVDDAEVISLRGTIIVVPSESEIWHVEATSGQFTAQTCAFPFTFNSVNYTQCTSVNDTQLWCSPTSVYTGQRLYCASTNSSTNSTCPSNVFNGSLCNETVSQPIQFRSTLCTVGSVSSITPTEGIIGTLVTITGTGFDGDLCEYDIQFGASHHCPLINKTSNQITCQITSNSMLDGSTSYAVRVLRYRQGYLRDEMSIRFNFLASISNITPMKGSIYGGTQVTIDGVGFIPGSTRVFLAEIDYTHLATITYSQIILTTPSQTYDLDRNINIYVGTNQVKCLIPSCSFQWTQRLTPYLDSVTPQSIHGPTNLTILGRNLLAGNINYTDVQLSIAGSSCIVTGMTNYSLNCSITGIEAGTHQILGSINSIGNINSSANVTSEAILISSSPSSSSIYGNATLRIIGNGFSTNINNIKVMVGYNPCNVVRATGGEIQCTIPAHNGSSNLVAITVTSNRNQFSSSLSLQYDTSITPNIISLTANTNSVSTALSISGSNFVTGYTNVHVGNYLCAITQVTSVSITCTLSSQQSAGNHSVIVYVDNVGNSNSDIVYTHPLILTNVSSTKGSYGGGLPVTIVGNGFNGNDISVSVCNQPCSSVTAVSNTRLICVTPSIVMNSVNHLCNLTVTVNGISENTLFTYTANLTSTITSISPVQGGTGGGTIVTITGTGFPNSIQIVSVYIDDVICSILTINSTAIRCETGSHYQTNLKAAVRVYINDNGYAIGDVFFGYVNRWSSRWTWGGDQPPEACSIVSIEKGATVYLDQSTPILESLIIDNATLIFEDSKDIELRVQYIIIVNGGSLQIGTESNPFQHRAIITMYGHVRSRELPIFGAKVLAVRNGTLDMHGKSTVRTWTQLGATAINGSSTITLKQAVDWSIGNQIVIATTGDRLSQIESEVRRITNIASDNRTLTLDQPLQYTHLGIIHQLNTTTIEVRGEVGLLSHNIIFRGMPTDTTTGTIIENLVESNSDDLSGQTCWRIEAGQEFSSDQFGAIIIASQETSIFGQTQLAVIRISNVELYNVGQGFRVGRYPIYFRQNGNMSESYVKSSSIHLSYNRAINIQASNYITLENNVIYDILGNGIVLNDGIEIGNVFRNNLVVFVRSSLTLFNEDFSPAAFWLSNPNNTLEQNAVAGCSHYGYWYRLLEQTDELPYDPQKVFYPYKQPFGRFDGNSVHSTSLIGVWIYPLYQPTISGLRDDRTLSIAVFQGLISWKNAKGIEYISSKMIQIKNALIFDNTDTGIACSTAVRYDEIDVNGLRSTFFNAENGSGIIDSIIIGDANISSEVIVPSTAGLIVIWGRGFLVQNVTFMNFFTNQTPAIIGPTLNDRCRDHCGGWTIKFYKMSFINVANRARLRWQYDALFENSDRTLTDQNDSVIVMARDGLTNTLPSCTPASDFENAVQCSLSEGPWIRLSLTENLNYRSSINSGPLTITDENNTTVNVSWYYEGLTYAQGYTMLLKVNKTYQFSYSNTLNWDNITYLIALYDLAPGDYFIIQHRMAFKPNIALINESLTPLSGMNSTHGQWFYDNNTYIFSYIIKSSPIASIAADISLTFTTCRCTCPNCRCNNYVCPDCACPTRSPGSSGPTQPTTEAPRLTCVRREIRYWSNDSHWTEPQEYQNWNRTKPSNYQNIWIPWCYHLIIDCPLPTIRSLRIDGIVEFQQGRNHTMYIDSIIISEGGALIAGSQNNPFNGNIDIILTNNNSINAYLPFSLPSLQSRQIAVKGRLDLHGLARNIVWTRLATTAKSGSNLFVLSESIDWSVGDEIIITTTDTDISHTERHRIASIINGTTIQTVNSLAYAHRVIRQIFPNGKSINIAAAVGLLTRTIRIKSNNGRTDPLGARIYIAPNTLYSGDNKGYAHLSHIQFINFGQFDGTTSSDYKKSGIYMQNLSTYNQNRLTNIYGCSFDGGFDAAITMRNTHSITIENNIIYNTYRSGIFVTGRNNVIRKNLLTTIYWTGTQNPSTVSIDTNYDAAIMSDNSVSVIMQNNLVAGVERLAYRVQGDTCSVGNIPQDTINDFSNNEAHSTMAGVNIWPSDRGLVFDRQCVLIKKFIVYKAWYYGFYINTYRNITIDSCASIDNHVGIFTFIVGPAAETHVTVRSRVNIQNSIVTGSITPNDCDDKINFNSENIKASRIALPIVAPDSKNGRYGSRSGIVFPMVSKNNKMPAAPWTGIIHYPSLDGSMLITNVTLAFFNNTCGRHDIAIQASQSNDDIQFPITTKSIFKYNLSESNLIFNGEPNSEQIRAQDCGDMDCDGLKKILIVDTDGTCLNTPGSTFSISERFWGNAQRGTGYFQIPPEAYTTPSGIRFNISSIYPYTGIIRSSSCSLQDSWQMYRCDNTPDYRMLVIENMDRRNELGQFSPVTIISDNGYIDLINGPQDHGECTSELCRRRLSTFMAIVQSGRTYQIYFKRYPIPQHLRFRLINADESIKCILAIYYNSMEHLDVYTNGIYTGPTNRDTSTSYLLLLDQPNRVNLTSQAGANYQDRTYQLAYFLINGDTTIDIKKASYFILNFGLPPVNESTFFLNDVARNFAAFFNIDPVKIRRVKIVRETGSNRSRSDQVSQTLVMELRNEPALSSASSRDVNVEIMSNIVSTMMNSYQSGELNIAWKNRDFTGGVVPLYLTVQEPFNISNVSLSIINRTELRIAPDDCREQSPCTIQPVLVAYDAEGNIIEKLGSIERPWQVKASIVNRPNLVLMGNVANYSDGQTQFRFLGLPSMGSFEILFTFVRPDGVTSSFFQKTNLTARSDAITVSDAILAGQQVNNIYVVNVNETFSISVTPIDSITRGQLGKIQWGNWTWIADAKLYTLPKYQHQGVLLKHNFSTTVVSVSASTVTLSGLVIDTPAMYILNIQLVSTNNQHSFTLASNGILVKDNESDSFVDEVDELLCNIVFKGDYNALSSSNQLEIKRAMIYNYLRSINMPMISDIVFVEGDLIAKFQVDSFPTNISQAVSSILSNPNAIPDLSISSVNINGRTFSILSNENTSTSDGNKTGLIIGIVIGLLAGTLLTIGGIWLYRKKSRKNDQLSSSEFLDIDDDEAAWRRKMKIVLPELETKIEQND